MTRLHDVLAPDKLVDLTHPLGPATVLWPGTGPFSATVEIDHDSGGAYARTLTLPEHSGTHLDAPVHFSRDGAAVDELPLGSLVRPAVRLDVRDLVGTDAGFTLTAAHVEAIEGDEGEVPAGSAVLVNTGWDRFALDPERYVGAAGSIAFPGIAEDAARLLVDRGVAGIGIDTLSIDPGSSTDYPAHRVTLPAGLWQLEGLTNLERVPARGAWIVAAVIPVVAGSGAPARVFAVLPD